MNIRSLNANFDNLIGLLTNYDILSDIIAMSRCVARNSQWGGLILGSNLGSGAPQAYGGLGAKAAGGIRVWGRSPQRSKILHFFLQK